MASRHQQLLLDDALRSHYAQLVERNDMHTLHISDLTQCVRAVWYRRNGAVQLPISPARRITMARGRAVELEIREALDAHLTAEGWRVFHASNDNGELIGYLTLHGDGELGAGFFADDVPALLGPNFRDAIGHLDMLARHDHRREIAIYEVKSLPFLGPAPKTTHVIQTSGYELLARVHEPDFAVHSFVIEVSAVTGEYRVHALEPAVRDKEIVDRLHERMWTTAAGDPMPEPSIPDEQFVERGRKGAKTMINLLCEKYCGYTECSENHVGEENELAEG